MQKATLMQKATQDVVHFDDPGLGLFVGEPRSGTIATRVWINNDGCVEDCGKSEGNCAVVHGDGEHDRIGNLGQRAEREKSVLGGVDVVGIFLEFQKLRIGCSVTLQEFAEHLLLKHLSLVLGSKTKNGGDLQQRL